LIGNQQGENMADDDAVIGAEPVEESIGDFISEQFDAAEASDIESAPVEEIRDRAEESVPQEAVEVSAETVTDEGNAEPESQITTAPQSMSAKDREAYYALTPEQQKWVSDRDREQQADYTKKTMEVAEQRKYYEDLDRVAGSRREQFAMNGMNVAQGFEQLLSLSDFAQRDPIGFTSYLLESRGLSLADVANQQAGGQVPSDPQIVDLQQRLAAQENHIAQQNQQQLEQQGQVVSGVINDFASKHPFYEDLHDDMVPIVVSLKESKPGLSHDQYLDMAYKMAAAANDNVSSKMEIDRQAKANADRVAKAKQTAANARRAGGTNIQSTGTLPPNVAHSKNVDDFIGALVDERISA
jgi:hypothetical protein